MKEQRTMWKSFVFTFLIIFGKAEDDWEDLMKVRNAATEQMSKKEVDQVRIFFCHWALNQFFKAWHFHVSTFTLHPENLSAALSLSKLSR